jgi:hypothetical protein
VIESRSIAKRYLEYHWKTVAKKNQSGEIEIVPSKYCKVGEVVWILEGDRFIKTIIV